jgi:hypothetical protein
MLAIRIPRHDWNPPERAVIEAARQALAERTVASLNAKRPGPPTAPSS